MKLVTTVRTRVHQVQAHRSSLPAPAIPPGLRALLSDAAHARFITLSPADQRHLIDVAARLTERGASGDLVTAGLLHDIGKARHGQRIRIVDRVAYVLLPKPVRGWIGNRAPGALTAGIVALYHHASAGADMVAGWGYPERVEWLIRHHERRELADPELQLLIDADDASDGNPTK